MAVLYRFREFLTAIADAIRMQTGGTDPIKALDMPNIIKTLAVKLPGVGGVNYIAFDAEGYATEAEVWGKANRADFYNNDSNYKISKLLIKDEIDEIPGVYCYMLKTLVELRIPATLKTIGANAFYYNESLSQIVLSDGRINQIPEGVTDIPGGAFRRCLALFGLKLHDNISTVGEYGFSTTPLNLTNLPANLTKVYGWGFADCRATFKTIPASVTHLDKYCFQQNPGLTEITFLGTPTTLVSTAFSNCVNLKTMSVPWAEGAVPGAPWGATNAVINYDYEEGDIV